MADQLYVSYWLRGFSAMSMLRHYEQALRLFPFSKLAKSDSVFRIYAIAYHEPILMEVPAAPPVNVDAVLNVARDYPASDVCYELEAAWDLWQWDNDWKLAPSRVLISCYGPEFESGDGENLRIGFGLDEQFLPGPGAEEGMTMVKSNIQSLLRLVHDVDDKLPVERRQLWSESGENFAELLAQALAAHERPS